LNVRALLETELKPPIELRNRQAEADSEAARVAAWKAKKTIRLKTALSKTRRKVAGVEQRLRALAHRQDGAIAFQVTPPAPYPGATTPRGAAAAYGVVWWLGWGGGGGGRGGRGVFVGCGATAYNAC
jgi:hypothetical protein